MAKEAKESNEPTGRSTEKQKALDTALAQIERQFGKGSVMKMSERSIAAIEVISTLLISLSFG